MNTKPHFNKPNFFILGAAKSGTTSLYHYLNKHPEVFMSEIKEPTFWCEDFQLVDNPITYFELFDGAKDEKYRGEASHGYLSDPKVARLIKTLFPDSKFIVILRNPADRAYSLYCHMRRYASEKINTFEKALAEEEVRYESADFKKNNGQYFHNFLYFRSGEYGAQIQRYFDYFDESQFLFLSFNELKQNLNDTLAKVWAFLDIDPNITIEPEVFNKGYHNKNRFLGRLIMSKVLRNDFVDKTSIRDTLIKLNNTNVKPLNPETKKVLMKRYEPDLKLLFQLTGLKF